VLELQERNDLPQSSAIVISTGQTIAMATGAHRFFKKVEFDSARVSPILHERADDRIEVRLHAGREFGHVVGAQGSLRA
jgi:hypothetical protein